MKSKSESIFTRIKAHILPGLTIIVLGVLVFLYMWDRRPVSERVADTVSRGTGVEVCEKFSQATTTDNISYSTICKNNIAKRLAVEKMDISYCNQLDGILMSQDSCMTEVMDLRIKSLGAKEACVGADPNDVAGTICAAAQKDELITKAVEMGDCSLVSFDSNLASMCKDKLLIKKLVAEPKKVTCSSFSSDEEEAACTVFKKIIAEKKSTVSSCDIIRNFELQRACAEAVGKIQ